MLILFRFYNSLSLGTFFVPDEYWQSIEVAHNFVFDYGYLTWEWKEKIRSFSYPLLFTLPYMILKHFNLDNTDLLIYFPRLIHVFIAALCDLYTYKLTKKYFGRNAAKWALFCSMLSWSNWNILVRTVSNSIETTLTVMALYYWPLQKPKNGGEVPIKDFIIALALAAIACFFRPTNGVVWIFLGLSLIFQYRKSFKALSNIIYYVLIVLIITLIISIGIDKFYFNEWIISPWNFIKFNIIENISIFYGDNSWHWYFSCGLPFVGYTFLIFMIPGVITSHFNILFYLLLWTVGIYSNLVHKEYRFIYPIVPIIFFYSGYFLDVISKYDQKIKSFIKKYIWKCVALLVLTNIPLAFYISNVHQRGVMDATFFLRKEVRQHDANGILYLMPCHSTPFYSYIHKNITLDFLTCEPPIGEKDIKAYKSEEDFFFEDPKYFLFNHFSHTIGNSTIKYPTDGKYAHPLENIPKKEWPNYIIFFDNIYDDIKFIFEGSNYKEVKRFFNSHFNIKKRKGDIIIYSNIENIENEKKNN
ncbi:glycosyltransferase family 22 protein [Piromyces sp. E2]|nr:glycosyltransferase family 22 protein [Piromyces sp. E2]|eukprot:OUM59808.1 glycosyltransferase family 22 protein [Piromyces sp. E2]